MVALVLTIIFSYVAVSLFGYVVHWALHQPWAGKFNTAHMTHHDKLYPASDFSSETYRHAGEDSSPKYFVIAAIPMLLIPIILWVLGILSFLVMLSSLAVMIGVGILHNYLHDAFHIKKHWLSCIPVIRVIFQKWVALHYLHHVDVSRNFGIFAFHWDKIFKTFSKSSS